MASTSSSAATSSSTSPPRPSSGWCARWPSGSRLGARWCSPPPSRCCTRRPACASSAASTPSSMSARRTCPRRRPSARAGCGAASGREAARETGGIQAGFPRWEAARSCGGTQGGLPTVRRLRRPQPRDSGRFPTVGGSELQPRDSGRFATVRLGAAAGLGPLRRVEALGAAAGLGPASPGGRWLGARRDSGRVPPVGAAPRAGHEPFLRAVPRCEALGSRQERQEETPLSPRPTRLFAQVLDGVGGGGLADGGLPAALPRAGSGPRPPRATCWGCCWNCARPSPRPPPSTAGPCAPWRRGGRAPTPFFLNHARLRVACAKAIERMEGGGGPAEGWRANRRARRTGRAGGLAVRCAPL